MEKVNDFLATIPDKMIDFINKQTGVKECEDYFAQVERQIKNYKKYGTFNIPPASTTDVVDNDNNQLPLRESQQTRQTVLNENCVSRIKLERISEARSDDLVTSDNRDSFEENIKNEELMLPPQLHVEKHQRIKIEPNVSNTRSTRSRTSKKPTTDDTYNREPDVILQKDTVETMSLPDSGNECEPKGGRITRTKTRKKKNQGVPETTKRHKSPSTNVGGSKEKLDATYVTNKKNDDFDQLGIVEKVIPEKVEVVNQEIPIRTGSRCRNHGTDERDHRDRNLTPQMANRYLAVPSNSATPSTRRNGINEIFISTKSASALKASQQEFREREARRREKETGAIRKRDALIQAQIEEKKKNRLEKQNKAQQTRGVLEKNKMKNLEEVERAKEEKRKQVLGEKQEKIRKQQEDTERRRQGAIKKAGKERQRAAEKQENLQLMGAYKKKGLPLYCREEAPLLPTNDCYDSDQERGKHTTKPAWASQDRLEEQLRAMNWIGEDVINNFFVLGNITPDLRNIFEGIDPKKLKRTSSAVWKVPPRFAVVHDSIKEDDEEEY